MSRSKPISEYPVVETFTATPAEEQDALARIYRLLENFLLTHPVFTPIMVVQEHQDSQKGRGDR